MSGEVVRPSICLGLNYAPGRFAVAGARDQQFADTLASDLKNRLRVEIAWELQTAFSWILRAFGSKLSLKYEQTQTQISIQIWAMPPKKNNSSPADLIRPGASLSDLHKAAQECRGCDIWERATQAVLGEGGPGA